MEETTAPIEAAPVVTKTPVEPIVVVVAGTMLVLTLVLMFVTRKHLRARQIAPVDSPIRVE